MVRLDRAGRCETGPLAVVRRSAGRLGARAARVVVVQVVVVDDEEAAAAAVRCLEEEDEEDEETWRARRDECELRGGGVLDS